MTHGKILMLVQNNSYPQDTRVRLEVEALQRAGFGVSVISPAAKGQVWKEVHSGVSIFRFPMPFEARGFWGYVWEYFYCTVSIFLLSLLVWSCRGFDVLHAANPSDTLFLVAAFYKLFGKRFVYDHHDLSPELYDANCGGNGNRLVYSALVWLEKRSCRLADHIIATNESYKQVEIERGGASPERITIVRNGPDLARFHLVEPDTALSASGNTVIAYVGEMGFHDGIDYLLRALRHLVCDLRRTNFLCILIGRGPALPDLKRMRETLGLSDRVRFTGWISEAEKLRYLSTADICVDPDPWNPFNDRSTMIKVAEYMALRKPIVAFDLRETRFTAQEAALFAPPNDEMELAKRLVELMDDPVRRQAMGEQGRRRVESKLSWSHSVIHLLTVYRSLFPERRSEPIPTDGFEQASA